MKQSEKNQPGNAQQIQAAFAAINSLRPVGIWT